MNKQALQIRLAQKKDLSLILQMIKELAAFHDLSDKVKADEENLHYSFFEDPKGPDALIGEEQNQPVGFIVFCELLVPKGSELPILSNKCCSLLF